MTKFKILAICIYSLPFLLLLNLWPQYVLFLLGLVFGAFLLVADEQYLFKYYLESQQNKFSQLITRSLLFLISLVPLGFFVVTSTGSYLAIGLVFGLIIGLLQEMWWFCKKKDLFKKRFLTDLKLKAEDIDCQRIVWIATGVFIVLNILLLT